MRKTGILALWLIVNFFSLTILAQERSKAGNGKKRDLIQFSGVIVENDSLKPVPYTSIVIKHSNRGTISDYFGFFSLVAQKTDTIQFSALGFKRAEFIIPDSLTTNKYSLIQVLIKDTISLHEAVVYPWPSKEQFKEAFLRLEIPDDDLERARKNLAREELREQAQGMSMDGSMNYKHQMQQRYSKLYYAGQLPPNNLLNPIAWAKFIKAWQEGAYSKKE